MPAQVRTNKRIKISLVFRYCSGNFWLSINNFTLVSVPGIFVSAKCVYVCVYVCLYVHLYVCILYCMYVRILMCYSDSDNKHLYIGTRSLQYLLSSIFIQTDNPVSRPVRTSNPCTHCNCYILYALVGTRPVKYPWHSGCYMSSAKVQF